MVRLPCCGQNIEAHKMPTLFRVLGQMLDLDQARFQEVLPDSMRLEARQDAMYLHVAMAKEEEAAAQYQVDREFDRVFFLTCIRLNAEMCRKIAKGYARGSWSVQGAMPQSTGKQVWSYNLVLQLRLWSIASDTDDELIKILLYFQIIELSYPDLSNKSHYPKYSERSQNPDPLTECKLIKNLVVHAGDVENNFCDMKKYCAYLGLPEVMLDRTDSEQIAIISRKVSLLASEARRVLQSALQTGL